MKVSVFVFAPYYLQTLRASPLLRTFSDHLWAVVKTAHERDLLSVIHSHSKTKAAYSGRFPGKRTPHPQKLSSNYHFP